MDVQKDFRDLLELFTGNKVEFIIVGAYALAFHGAPRFTGDLDILVRPTVQNAQAIVRSLESFGFGSLGLIPDDFLQSESVVQLGVAPVRIDILTSITGVSWEMADSGKEAGAYGDIPVFFLGKNEYAINKKTIGRKKDLADLEALDGC
ncbi:MAG: hypothetical protein WC799_07460 [Desulfobacteraceae bacterium]